MTSTPPAPSRDLGPLDLLARHIGATWVGVSAVVLVTAYGLQPQDAIARLLEADGVGEAEQQAVAVAGALTLPLVVGVATLALMATRGTLRGLTAQGRLFASCAVLVAAGMLGRMGWGLAPDYTVPVPSGPWYVALPAGVLGSYLSAYGVGLVLTGTAVGLGVAAQGHRWLGGPPRA